MTARVAVTEVEGGALLAAIGEGGVPVGRALVAIEGVVATLSDVEVDRGRRSEGIGTALVDAAERLAAEGGAQEVRLEVEQENAPARRLYERLGYEVTGAVRCCGSDAPGFAMRKRLAAPAP